MYISTEVFEADQPLLLDVPAKLSGSLAAGAQMSRGSVASTLYAAATKTDAEDAFFVADLGEVQRQFVQWTQLLPRVQPFFAVKCNPDPLVVKLMARLGAGFDCASKAELQQVLDEGI
ncbi:Ornithine decarboxylase, partial [Kickxella alabastrina]